jgi:hypothetical protein
MVVLEMKITEKVTTWCLEHFEKFHEKALISLSLSGGSRRSKVVRASKMCLYNSSTTITFWTYLNRM